MDMDDDHSPAIFFCLFAALLLFIFSRTERTQPNLRHIPTLGRTSYSLSYFDALKFLTNGRALLQQGYQKYRGAMFKISTLNRWVVLMTGTRTIEELRKASEHEISFTSAVDKPDSSLYAGGHYKAVVAQGLELSTRYITQNIAFIIPVVHEEVVSVSDGFIPSNTIVGWHELHAINLVTTTTAKVIGRILVGDSFSQDQEYAHLVASLALGGYQYWLPIAFAVLPATLRSTLRYFSKHHRKMRRLQLLTESYVRRRKVEPKKPKDESHKNMDLISLLVTNATAEETLPNISTTLSELLVTTTRTISLTFAHALYYLASNPKYAAALRKEIHSAVSHEGWNKTSLNKMYKVDSFLKESMRMSNISSVSSLRKVMQPYTFADGTHLPEDTLLAIAAQARHLDENLYASAHLFDGFRFSDMHDQRYGDDSTISSGMQFQLVSTSANFLAWGYGRHACPGRFFAAAVMKIMLAHTVLHYDVRFEDGVRPEDVVIGTNNLPNPSAKILFRRRVI